MIIVVNIYNGNLNSKFGSKLSVSLVKSLQYFRKWRDRRLFRNEHKYSKKKVSYVDDSGCSILTGKYEVLVFECDDFGRYLSFLVWNRRQIVVLLHVFWSLHSRIFPVAINTRMYLWKLSYLLDGLFLFFRILGRRGGGAMLGRYFSKTLLHRW